MINCHTVPIMWPLQAGEDNGKTAEACRIETERGVELIKVYDAGCGYIFITREYDRSVPVYRHVE